MKHSKWKYMFLCVAGFMGICGMIGSCVVTVSARQNLISVSGNDGAYASDPEEGEEGNGLEEENRFKDENMEEEIGTKEDIFCLQVPDNLDFVIDPWNLAGCGQIYSDQFVIKNCGNSACILYLQDIMCSVTEDVVMLENRTEIYTRNAAELYMEMVFDNGDILILSTESREYTVILEPDDELTFWFDGVVNENTSKKWMDQKVSVSLKYSCEYVSDILESGIEEVKKIQKEMA